MAYHIRPEEGLQFTYEGERYALAVELPPDEDSFYEVALYKKVGEAWNMIPPYLDAMLTNEEIMAHETVADYMRDVLLPAATKRIREVLRPQIVKPSFEDKRACVAYDLAMDVRFDPETLSFVFNKEPPLSHAR